MTPRDAARIHRRLAYLEGEYADAVRLFGLMTDDLRELRAGFELGEQRLMIVVGPVAALLVSLGIEPGGVAAWVLALAADDLADAIAGAETIVQQLALLHGPVGGES